MLGQKKYLVIWVTPHALIWIASGGDSPQTLSLPPTIVDNLEVKNRDALYTLISEWVKTRTYAPTEVIWLLSPETYFEQTFLDSEKDSWDSNTVQFLDSVPFEELISRVYTPVEGRQVVALNKAFLAPLMQAFAIHGYNTRCVIPSSLATSEDSLTIDVYHAVISRINDLSRDSLVPAQGQILPPAPSSGGKKSSSSLPILLSIFGVLFAILIAVLFLR